MRSRASGGFSGAAMAALAAGALTGVGIALLLAPMRGSDMRAALRRRGLASAPGDPATLSASLGEIAAMHDKDIVSNREVAS